MKISFHDLINEPSDDEDNLIEDGFEYPANLLDFKHSTGTGDLPQILVDEELSNFLATSLSLDTKNIPKYDHSFLRYSNTSSNEEPTSDATSRSAFKSFKALDKILENSKLSNSPLSVKHYSEEKQIPLLENLLHNMQRIEQRNAMALKEVQLEKQKQIEEERRRAEEAKKIEEERKRKEEEERKRIEEEELKKSKEAELKKEKMRNELLARQKAEAENKKKKEELEKQKQEELKKEELKSSVGVYSSSSIEAEFNKHKQRIQDIKEQIVTPASKDKELKGTLSKHKRKINPKFGQLTNSFKQLQSVTEELIGLINQTRSSEIAYKWILNFIAKAVVSQAESEVGVKPEAAVPLGKLTLSLMCTYPELLPDFLLPRFVKKCPLVIGYSCPIDTEQQRTKMGWKRKSDGTWEDEVKYNERLSGMVTLFTTINRLVVPNVDQMIHPLPMAYSWRLVSRIANTNRELITNTHFAVLGAFWESCAHFFLLCYGNQASKLLTLISMDLTNLVSDKKLVSAARLRILAETWQSSGSIPTFPEMDP
ncbi:hypothetical protein ACO0QE_002593 [Hanseniaspora vineae]